MSLNLFRKLLNRKRKKKPLYDFVLVAARQKVKGRWHCGSHPWECSAVRLSRERMKAGKGR